MKRADVNLLSRLDRLPVTRDGVRIIILVSLVWLAEAFDIGIVGPVLATLDKAWALVWWQTGLLAVASTLGVVLGMIPSGWLADKFGRRKVVIVGILFFSIVTLLGSMAANFGMLFAIRLVAGLGEGAVLPMPYLFLSEFVRSRQRAVMVGYSNGILTAAYVIPSVASLWALHAFPVDLAWRVPFILGAIPLFLVIPLYLWLPESPRYLLQRGRAADVRRMVERMETQANLPHDTTLVDDRLVCIAKHDVNPGLIKSQRKPLMRRSAMVLAQLTAALILFYILQVFGPTLLISRGTGTGNAILFSGLMMLTAGFGSVAQGYLSDQFGRKAILGTYALLASVGCVLFAFETSVVLVFVAGFLTAFFGLGIFPVSKLCVAEQYPTELRGRGVYWNEMIARTLSGIVTTYFLPLVLTRQNGSEVIFLGIAALMLLLNLPFFLFGRETAKVPMEQATSAFALPSMESQA